MPRIGFEKFIRNKTQTATLFVDLNKVPMHEIDLLVHRIAVFFFAFMPFLVSFLSSPLLFCVFGVLHRLLHNFQSPESTNDRLFVFFRFIPVSTVSLRPCLVPSRLHFSRLGQRGFKTPHHPPSTGHEVNCFLTCASSTLGQGHTYDDSKRVGCDNTSSPKYLIKRFVDLTVKTSFGFRKQLFRLSN